MIYDISDVKYEEKLNQLQKAFYTKNGYEALFSLLAQAPTKTFMKSYQNFIANYAESMVNYMEASYDFSIFINKEFDIAKTRLWDIDFENKELIINDSNSCPLGGPRNEV